MVDLHVHSCFSDGLLDIKEIEIKANKNGVSILSITDHDNIESCNYIKKNCLISNLRFVPGVEISTESYYFNKKMKVHLLGYGFEYNDEKLNKSLNELYDARKKDNKRYIETLIDKFKFLNDGMFEKFDYGKYGWIRKLILNEVSSDLTDSDYTKLKKYLELNRPIYHGYNMPIEKALSLLDSINCYSVLAHPFELKLSDDDLDEFLHYLVKNGLSGIETYHNGASLENIFYYHNLAVKYHLLESGGSDFHSPITDEIGSIYSEEYNEDCLFAKKLILEKRFIGGHI